MKPLRYSKWPRDPDRRWVAAADAFGSHLVAAAVDYATARVPASVDPAARELAAKAARDAVYGVMMLLDGVSPTDLGLDARAEYVLLSRVLSKKTGEVVEQFELAPDGDGLCMGFHGWVGDGGG